MLLALYPFRKRLRFSAGVTLIFVSVLTVVQVGLGIWAAFFAGKNSGLVTAVSTLIYAVFFFLSVKAPFGKTVFTLLMLSNISNFVIIASKCMEGIFFPALALQAYRWSFSHMMLILDAVLFVPLIIYIKKPTHRL